MDESSISLLTRALLDEIKGKHQQASVSREGAQAGLSAPQAAVPRIYVGSGSCGRVAGALETMAAIREYLDTNGLEARSIEVGCAGLCSLEPLMDVQLPGKARVSFTRVTAGKVADILDAVLNRTIPHENLLGQYREEGSEPWGKVPLVSAHAFFRNQQRLVLSQVGLIDPLSLEEYLLRGGFRAFVKTLLTYRPEQVCDIIEASGLRGRGGGGFPAAQKWRAVLQSASEQKYLVCNADDSDPGTFVGRALLEGDPYKLLEGILIAAYAAGASKAFLVLKHDYSLAIERVMHALEQLAQAGFSGQNILDSGVNLSITLRTTPGAFICGEETAMISSLEGKRAMPRPKPPYPSHSGYLGKPTVMSNLETLANVPAILQHGPQWFRGHGTATSPGTKVFSLSGKTVNQGLVEVPFGTSFREIVYGIGEGIKDNKALKAIHLGGPCGTTLDAGYLDSVVDFRVAEDPPTGLGAGGLVVLDEGNCLLDLAKYYLGFLQQESCGKCIPCREGTRRMADILESITQRPDQESGHQTLERFKGVMQLESLGEVIRDTSLCGLGKNAPNAVLSTLRLFREEYEEHIFDRQCRAGVCTHLRTYVIDIEKCTGCAACARKCPAAAIIGTPTHPHFIIEDKCTGCGICYDTCKFVAISIK